MHARIVSVLCAAVLAGSLVACAPAGPGTQPAENPGSEVPSVGQPADGAAGLRLAPGLWELADGMDQALGTLEYRDIEGGIWVITDGTKAVGDAGATVAVIANPDELGSKLESLKGASVIAIGEKLEGASIRMAGPEIQVVTIEKVSDTGGPAE